MHGALRGAWACSACQSFFAHPGFVVGHASRRSLLAIEHISDEFSRLSASKKGDTLQHAAFVFTRGLRRLGRSSCFCFMCLILYYEHGIHAGPNTSSIHFDSCSHPCVHRLFVALDFLLCVMACCLSRSCLRFSGVGRKMAIFWGPFSGHQFWQEGVRPNCLASPCLLYTSPSPRD